MGRLHTSFRRADVLTALARRAGLRRADLWRWQSAALGLVGLERRHLWRALDAVLQPLQDARDLRGLRRSGFHTPPELVDPRPYRGPPLNCLAHPRFWDDPAWTAVLEEIDPGERARLHRKGFELAQTAVGLAALGALHPEAKVLGVGAGHERILFWLARRVHRVYATDLYGNAEWSKGGAIEGDPTMLGNPAHFAKAPFPKDHLVVLPMDGRSLAFEGGSMDAVYSLSSIEHFGGADEVRQTMREIERVLKPGGVAALATELVVNGVPRGETFTPDQLEDSILRATGMKLVQPIDWTLSLPDLLSPVRLDRDPTALPHLVVRKGRTLFTSIALFFRKA